MKRAVLVATLAVACAHASPGSDRMSAGGRPPARPEGHVTAAPEPEPAPPCRRPWPHDPNDPRVGVYVFERPYTPDEQHYWAMPLIFDGTTVTREWQGFYNLPPDCVYGAFGDVPTLTMLRFHAHVSRDGTLWHLMPCYGWQELGRFLPDGRIDSPFERGFLRRVEEGDYGAFDAEWWDEGRDAAFWVCQEPYEAADGAPIPEPPR